MRRVVFESMKELNKQINKERHHLEWFYFLTDKWFRILEFSFILGTLGYFRYKTDSFSLDIIYWLSWILFFCWFLEIGEYLGKRFYSGDNFLKQELFIFLGTVPFLILYFLVTNAVGLIVSIGK